MGSCMRMQSQIAGLGRDVCAVVVTYRPQIEILRRMLDACLTQAGSVVLFDNATNSKEFDAFLDTLVGVEIIRSQENLGVGAALNHGIFRAREKGFRFVLTMDQDSVPDAGMIDSLVITFRKLSLSIPVAAVGPVHRDSRNGHAAPFVRIGFPFNRKLFASCGQNIVCDFLITSGCLISLDALESIGGMDEALFIDNVDLEWCFRARRRGYALYGIGDAGMGHAIGDALRTSWLRGSAFVHSPLRLYYIMRNRVLLYRRKDTPRAWIGQDLLRLPFKFMSTLLFLPPRGEYLRCMLRGLRDGLRGVTGPARFS